jgi:hypothetical protein
MRRIMTILISILAFVLWACQPQTASSGNSSVDSTALSFNTDSETVGTQPVSKANHPIFRMTLIDAPTPVFASIFVNISHFELVLKNRSKKARLILGTGIGTVDLLKLQNGKSLPIDEFQIPEDTEVQEIRIVLAANGHYGVRSDASVCEIRSPLKSSVVRIRLSQPIQMAKTFEYSMVVDFDALKSVASLSSSKCLLRPVIKIPQVTRRQLPTTRIDRASGREQALTNGTDQNDENDDGYGSDDEESADSANESNNADNGSSNDGSEQEPNAITLDQLYSYFAIQ